MEEQTVKKRDRFLGIGILIAAAIIIGIWNHPAPAARNSTQVLGQTAGESEKNTLEEMVVPQAGVVLPVRWGGLGTKMVAAGVIDEKKFEELYAARGGMTDEVKQMLNGSNGGNIKITKENSGTVLNLLWALGLSNKNNILTNGPMTDPQYGGAQVFASTGGWTLARGNVMNHYGKHEFIVLTPEQQALVERVSKNIYRPCCGNSTYFPDCNHGMAMLGLLELMASQGVSENEMYKTALQVNSYWFPDTYLNIAQYLKSRGIDWSGADPRGILGANFSSAQGYQAILAEMMPAEKKSGGSCGV